jgi:hypothetical protein
MAILKVKRKKLAQNLVQVHPMWSVNLKICFVFREFFTEKKDKIWTILSASNKNHRF